MNLPVTAPVLPMLAKRVGELPEGEGWIFRAEVGRLSRAGLPRRRRDPHPEPRREAARTATSPSWSSRCRRSCPQRCVLDGEIVIARGERARLRGAAAAPASGRVAREAARRADPGVDRVLRSALRGRSRSARRALSRAPRARWRRCSRRATPPIHLTPATTRSRRRRGLVSPLRRRGARRRHGQAGDGRLRAEQARDAQGEARARLRLRGGRLSLAQEGRGHGGRLAAARPLRRRRRAAARRRVRELHRRRSGASWPSSWRPIARTRSPIIPGRTGPSAERDGDGRSACPAAQSRWSQGKDLSWEPLRPELVVEVAYEHMQGTRFRHMAQFRRWRTDKTPRDCTYAQLEVVPPQELTAIFADGR